MPPPDALLLAALHAAPRRYRLPPLPADAGAARASGPPGALAFAIEAARLGLQAGVAPPDAVSGLFTWALAGLVRAALAPEGGDAAFRALVLRARDAQVAEHVQLAAQAPADRRAVRAAADALAHPGKLRALPHGPVREALAGLHGLAQDGAWAPLRQAAQRLLAQHALPDLRALLAALADSPSLARLERGDALLQLDGVRSYLALCEQRGPLAGSDAAAAQGRASARLGAIAEQAAVQAFHAIAGLLDRHGPGQHRVVRSLRTPRGFPGAAGNAKDEWDAAIVRGTGIVLLAEVKAAPAAAAPDFARLLRGLQRLAQADAEAVYAFPSLDGEVRLGGSSLRGLRPQGQVLPPHVLYCCAAPPEAQPQLLGPASRAVLLAEPASLAFAHELDRGAAPADALLLPVWEALVTEPRMRAALHQAPTARAVRQAMLHPDDLLAACRQSLG